MPVVLQRRRKCASAAARRAPACLLNRFRKSSRPSPAALPQTWVDWLSTPVAADPGHGVFRPTSDFLAHGAGTNSRVLRGNVQANRSGKRSCVGTNWHPMRPALAPGSHRERRRAGRRTCNWRRPPITPILGVAPSGYRGISQPMAPAPILGSCAVTFRQVVRAKGVARGCSRAKWGIVPASGGWFPSASGPHRAVDLQLAPSTHMKLARHNRSTEVPNNAPK